MKRIFCISGLGADERIFKKLAIEGAELVPLKWLPITEEDDMRSYAQKMSLQIADEVPIILGLSFGGMIATQISKIRQVEKVILISSAKTRKEVGYNNPFWSFLVNANLVPYSLSRLMIPLSYYRLGIKSEEEKRLVAEMNNKMDTDFLKNALRIIVNWKNTDHPGSIIHIHGTKDRILMTKNISATYWVEDGGHFMIYNKASIVSKLIEQHL